MKQSKIRCSFNINKILILLLMVSLLALSPYNAVSFEISDQINFNELEKIALEEMKEKNTPGAAIAIIKGDKVIFVKGLGVRSIETGEEVTADTLFRLGSTTKMFTGAAILTLEEQGKIKLDSPISNYVKGLSPNLSKVTADQLVSNTAGLRDSVVPLQTDDDDGLSRMIRSWKDDVFFTEPGKIYSYSSAGFWLAGLVIEDICGKPYADDMNELLFKPLGMKRTTFRPLVAVTYPLALGHNIQSDGKPVIVRPAFNNVAMWPAGSIYSSVNDLSRWIIALMNDGRIDGRETISPSLIKKLTGVHAPMPGDADSHYGYGIMQFKSRGVRFRGHGGFSRGYGSMIQMAPDQKYAVIVLTNKSGETLPKTLNKAFELGIKLDPVPEEKPAPEIAVTQKEMVQYTGVYLHPPTEWRIFIKDGKLFIKQEDGEYALKKTGTDKFTYGNSNENEIVLVRGSDGKVEHLFNGLYSAKKTPFGQ
jgi:CubicO group peptidase (beta-lactamase class C family)